MQNFKFSLQLLFTVLLMVFYAPSSHGEFYNKMKMPDRHYVSPSVIQKYIDDVYARYSDKSPTGLLSIDPIRIYGYRPEFEPPDISPVGLVPPKTRPVSITPAQMMPDQLLPVQMMPIMDYDTPEANETPNSQTRYAYFKTYDRSGYPLYPDFMPAHLPGGLAIRLEDYSGGDDGGLRMMRSDGMLPAYCNPPNPCPVGYTADQGCVEIFENTAEFSVNFQDAQQCMCDTEHMFMCDPQSIVQPQDDIGGFGGDFLKRQMPGSGQHKNLVAKKFHPSKSSPMNPYLVGEKLPVAAKKGFKSS